MRWRMEVDYSPHVTIPGRNDKREPRSIVPMIFEPRKDECRFD